MCRLDSKFRHALISVDMTFRYHFALLAAAAALAISGCGNHPGSEAPAMNVDLATTGSLIGTVTLDGPPPTYKPIDMSASPVCVQENPQPVFSPLVVTGDKGGLANVVVYLKKGLGNYRYDTPAQTVVLQQKNCMYEPHVVALMTGQPFEVQNNDPTMHNVHPLPRQNRQWSTSQPAGSAALKETFARPEFAMSVLCNIHPWMRSMVFVFDHPYFAVTPKTGSFELNNLPPGTYTVEAWHESLGTQDQTVRVGPRESKVIAFTFQSPGNHGD
jgi:plastocyanin